MFSITISKFPKGFIILFIIFHYSHSCEKQVFLKIITIIMHNFFVIIMTSDNSAIPSLSSFNPLNQQDNIIIAPSQLTKWRHKFSDCLRSHSWQEEETIWTSVCVTPKFVLLKISYFCWGSNMQLKTNLQFPPPRENNTFYPSIHWHAGIRKYQKP